MIGDLWTQYLRHTTMHRTTGDIVTIDDLAITPVDVAHLMNLLKVARSTLGDPKQVDNYIDAAGYESLAGALALGNNTVIPMTDQDEQNKAQLAEKLVAERERVKQAVTTDSLTDKPRHSTLQQAMDSVDKKTVNAAEGQAIDK